MKRKIISGNMLKRHRSSELVALDKDGRRNITLRWDSDTERKFYREILTPGTMCDPLLYRVVVVKPDAVRLGDTKIAPKYYPDFLVQLPDKSWQYIEVKGAVETTTWRKTLRMLADRIESGKLASEFLGQIVYPSLLVARRLQKPPRWDYETIYRRSA